MDYPAGRSRSRLNVDVAVITSCEGAPVVVRSVDAHAGRVGCGREDAPPRGRRSAGMRDRSARAGSPGEGCREGTGHGPRASTARIHGGLRTPAYR